MYEIKEFLALDIPIQFLFFLMLFSMGIAIFHTAIFSLLYNVNLKPKWIFFALNPLVLLVSYFILPALMAAAFGLMVASVFLLGIIGMIRAAIKGDPETKQYYITPKPKKPLWKRILIAVWVVVFCVVFVASGPYAFLIIFAIAFFGGIMPSSKNRFKKYQATLPTSKIRSLAMGLVEVEGKITTKQPLIARIEKKECIGYKYVVESISRDDDGRESYSQISAETVCNPFFITDETGTIEVNPEKIEFIWVEVDSRHSAGGRRYSQFLLKQNDHVLIIGKASVRGNTPIIEHENIKNVFGIAPLDKVTEYNTYKPILNSFAFFSGVLGIMVAILLVSPMEIKDGEVVMHLSAAIFDWNSFFNFLN